METQSLSESSSKGHGPRRNWDCLSWNRRAALKHRFVSQRLMQYSRNRPFKKKKKKLGDRISIEKLMLDIMLANMPAE